MNATYDTRARSVAAALLFLSITTYFCLSATSLLILGIPYDAPFGPAIAKIHPGSYLLMAAWFTALASHGNPLRVLGVQLLRERLLGIFAVCMVLVFLWTLIRHGSSGAAFIIESLWMPAFAASTFTLLTLKQQRRMLPWMVFLLMANAIVALIEFKLAARIIPLYIARDLLPDQYFRSSAFLGHPLVNAMMTLALLPGIALMPWPVWLRAVALSIAGLSLFAYGGRTSMVMAFLGYSVWGLMSLGSGLRHGRFSYAQITGGLLAMMAGVTAMAGVVASTGLGARFFNNLVWDNSASVRARIWDVFHFLSSEGWLFGIAPRQIDGIALRIGLDPKYEAIENFWIYNYLLFGIVGFAPFVIGLGCLVWRLWGLAPLPMRVGIVLYFIAASAANTLSSKGQTLIFLTLVIYAAAARRVPQTAVSPAVVRSVAPRSSPVARFALAGDGSR